MINWFKYPFIRILLPFAIGIWLAYSFQRSTTNVEIVALTSIIVVLTITIASLSAFLKSYSLRWLFGFTLNVLLILIGALTVHIRDADIDERHITFCDADSSYSYIARVSESPLIKEKSVKVVLEMVGVVRDADTILATTGKIMSYFERSTHSDTIKYGDLIVFFDPPEIVDPPQNPEQFDYKRFLLRKGIAHSVYLKNDRWLSLGVNQSNPIYRFSYWLRDNLLATMQRLGITGDEYAVAAAILIGYDDTLPDELRQSYVAAGSMHILCVSGMHVGVVFMVFSYMLAFLNKRKRAQYVIQQSLLLLLIWLYALLAGLAPSILRATIMLSFVIVGNILNRKGVLINSLAASAFLLLCIKPANLFDIGYLLSYTAVVGIVVLQKPIYQLFYIKFKPLDKIWEMTAVTLSAQIATAPFTIFFFHQFPLYFWLSNLFMTPISTVVIMGGMLMLLVSFIPYINIAVAWCVKWMIHIMNFVVISIEELPFSIIKGLYVNNLEFVCLLLIFILIMLTVTLKDKKFVFAMMSFALIFSVSQLYREIGQRSQQSFTVYSMSKGTAVDFVCGNKHVLLCDTTVYNNTSVAEFSINNHLIKEGVFKNGFNLLLDDENFENSFVKKHKNIVSFNEKLIGFSDEKAYFGVKLASRPYLDYFIACGKNNFDLEKLLNCYVVDLLIIDSSIPEFLRQKIIAKAKEIGQEYYDVKKQGAYIF